MVNNFNYLEETGQRILKIYDLPNRLNKYGEANLVGNLALGTTVKPDIDIQIYADRDIWANNADKIITEFQLLGINDYIQRELKESGKYLVSFALVLDETRWTIDITQTIPQEDFLKDAYTFYKKYIDKLDKKNRAQIIKLKKYFQKKGMLHHSMSYYIYRAVLEENISTVEEMYNYLNMNRVNIKRFRNKNK